MSKEHEFKTGEKVEYQMRDHRRAGIVLKTSEGTFIGFVGNRSALLEFEVNGRKVRQRVLLSAVREKP